MWGCNGIYERYSATAPADVALVSPQTPLTILFHPLLSGVCRRRHPYKAPLLTSFQWVFCVFTCNHPPQQTLHPSPPALPSSQAFREEGPFVRFIRQLRSDTRPAPTDIHTIYTKIFLLYRGISFDTHRSPCQRSCVGGAGGRSPSEGVLHRSPCQRSCVGGAGGRSPSEGVLASLPLPTKLRRGSWRAKPV